MQLNDFSRSTGKRRRPQRVGRGGKRGTTSGRGQKGQKSRSGHVIRPAERDLILRLPKLRGFANKADTKELVVVNLDTLETKFKKGGVVDMNALRSAKLVGKSFKGRVKILSRGEIKAPITIKGLAFSAAAKTKIEKAGGKVE